MLELAAELGSVAEACRRRGMDRISFYEWKRLFQTQGFAGLKDLAPIHKSHPQTTPAETVVRIRALALEHPAYGRRVQDGALPRLTWSEQFRARLAHQLLRWGTRMRRSVEKSNSAFFENIER